MHNCNKLRIFVVAVMAFGLLKGIMAAGTMPERCNYLTGIETMRRSCSGKYPTAVKVKYHDTFIDSGEPYALYFGPDFIDALVVLKESPLLGCQELRPKTDSIYDCLNTTSQRIDVDIDNGSLTCFAFHMRLVDDLMDACVRQNDFDKKLVEKVKGCKSGALQYTYEGASYGYNWPRPHRLGLWLLTGFWLIAMLGAAML